MISFVSSTGPLWCNVQRSRPRTTMFYLPLILPSTMAFQTIRLQENHYRPGALHIHPGRFQDTDRPFLRFSLLYFQASSTSSTFTIDLHLHSQGSTLSYPPPATCHPRATLHPNPLRISISSAFPFHARPHTFNKLTDSFPALT
ncbi:hypothetical protein BKA65DRAFT_58958 [Rhexocercosporidium sp. MPI-PUGE-AT-0058]|nr:hypothetical protein BKA65DRAFT_58958 [Rhexocercosporidium sp. MPI-PUGE-AT-0058]